MIIKNSFKISYFQNYFNFKLIYKHFIHEYTHQIFLISDSTGEPG